MRAGFIAATLMMLPSIAGAETIIDDWLSVKAPPPPELNSVNIDPKTDALLILDIDGHEAPNSGPCNSATNPRCIASLPKLHEMLQKARAMGVYVVYSTTHTAEDIRPEVAPKPGDPVVKSGPNKFIDTDLRTLLQAKGITTLIVTGTLSEGAVLNTASDAIFHGMKVILPVDGMSSVELYAEQYVAWHMTHAPRLGPMTTLTTLDRLAF